MSVVFKWDRKEMEQMLATCEEDDIPPYIQKHMPKGERLLESGSGAGRYVKYLHDRGWGITGIEISADTVKMVKTYWPELKIIRGDWANSPFPNGTFGGVLSLGVIEHWPEGPQPPLRDIFRVLRRGGKAIITVPVFSSIRKIKHTLWINELMMGPRFIFSWVIKGKKIPNRRKTGFVFHVYPTFGPFFEYRFTPQEFKAELGKAGFEILEHEPCSLLDGLYHELNPGKKLIKFVNWEFQVSWPGRILNSILEKKRFFHPHQQLAVVRKP